MTTFEQCPICRSPDIAKVETAAAQNADMPNITALGYRLAPPRPKRYLGSAGLPLLASLVFLGSTIANPEFFRSFMFTVGVLLLGMSLAGALHVFTYNGGEHLTRLARWKRSWICRKCGNISEAEA